MLLTLDNFDGFGPRDYTTALSLDKPPVIKRRLNQPALCTLDLVSTGAQFVVPVAGARIILARADGLALFTGYLSAPEYEYLGWNERGPVYRYALAAVSDEFILDRRMLPARSAFINRTAGNALAQLANDVLPGSFNAAAVQDVVTLPSFSINTEQPWSKHAADLAQRARAAYRAHNGALSFAPVGATVHSISESDSNFSPDNFKLASPQSLINDVTLTGADEPQAHVKNYFLGDGLTVRFNLSHRPFTRNDLTLVDEEFLNPSLASTRWSLADPHMQFPSVRARCRSQAAPAPMAPPPSPSPSRSSLAARCNSNMAMSCSTPHQMASSAAFTPAPSPPLIASLDSKSRPQARRA